jgi:hypothetical protein
MNTKADYGLGNLVVLLLASMHMFSKLKEILTGLPPYHESSSDYLLILSITKVRIPSTPKSGHHGCWQVFPKAPVNMPSLLDCTA